MDFDSKDFTTIDAADAATMRDERSTNVRKNGCDDEVPIGRRDREMVKPFAHCVPFDLRTVRLAAHAAAVHVRDLACYAEQRLDALYSISSNSSAVRVGLAIKSAYGSKAALNAAFVLSTSASSASFTRISGSSPPGAGKIARSSSSEASVQALNV